MTLRNILIAGGLLLAFAVVAIVAFLVGTRFNGGEQKEVAQVPQPTEKEPQQTQPPETTQSKQSPSKTIPVMTGVAGEGETADMGDRTITLNDVQRGYAFPHNVPKPAAGDEFALVNITITNKSTQPIQLNMLYFQSEDSNGVRRNANYTPDAPEPIPNVGSVAPGGTLTGNLAVEIPQGETNVKVVYRPQA